jgi:predicted DNA-binding protein (UPF0251 family)
MIDNSPNLRGRKRSLTPDEERKVVRLYSVELMTQAMIAKRFQVNQKTVKNILLRENVKKPNRAMDLR